MVSGDGTGPSVPRGDPEGATDVLDQAEQRYLRGFFPDVRPIPAMKARVRIAQGTLVQAAGWARERGVSATDDVSCLTEFDHLALVRLHIARHRAHQDAGAIDQAVRLLGRLLDAVETSGRAGSLVEIRMLQALAHDAQGHRPRAPRSARPGPGPTRPNRMATCGSSWTRAPP